MDSVRLVRLDGSLFFLQHVFSKVPLGLTNRNKQRRDEYQQQHFVLSFLITMMMKIFLVGTFLLGIPKYGVLGQRVSKDCRL